MSLLSAREEDGHPVRTEAQLRNEMIALLIGGHETTATDLAWSFYWVHKLPEVKDKLVQEYR